MKAEIITIGDELLIGQVINTNSTFIAQQLNLIGIAVIQITAVADDHEQIIKALNGASERADIVISTGGLGPTRDDITKLALCDYFKSHLVLHQPSLDNILQIFHSRGYPITLLNQKQAEIPAGCIPFINKNGTAPGMYFKQNGIHYFSLPGVPFEMKDLIINDVIPLLKPLSSKIILHKTVLTHGVGESFLAEKINDWEMALPDYFKLAYLPQPGIVRLRLSVTGNSREILQNELNEQLFLLFSIIGDYIYGEDDESLELVVGRMLNEHHLTLSTAESCTGGYLAHLITSIAGSSSYFNGSVVSYSNDVKVNVLGVKRQTLDQLGAVSEQTVFEMAEGVKRITNSDCTIAVSGIAGPDGGTFEKPVGTVWIAVHTPNTGTVAKRFLFGDDRERNIRRSALAALDMLRKQLISNNRSFK